MKTVTTEMVKGHPFQYRTTARQHSWSADTAAGKGGDTAANPVEHLLGALAECVAMTIEGAAAGKGWPVTNIRVTVTLDEIDDPDNAGQKISRFSESIEIEGPLDEKQVAGVKAAAKACTVFKLIERKKTFEANVTLVNPAVADTASTPAPVASGLPAATESAVPESAPPVVTTGNGKECAS